MNKTKIFNTYRRIRLGIWGLGRGAGFAALCDSLSVDVVAGCESYAPAREAFLSAVPGARSPFGTTAGRLSSRGTVSTAGGAGNINTSTRLIHSVRSCTSPELGQRECFLLQEQTAWLQT